MVKYIEILAVLSSKPQGSAQDKVVKKKFMIMSGMVVELYTYQYKFYITGFAVMPGSDLNQFSELTGSIMDSKDAKHTTPGIHLAATYSIDSLCLLNKIQHL